MTVFSVNVDMAFNNDRGVNDGGDGLNIREDATTKSSTAIGKHYGPKFSQNSPSWNTTNYGTHNQGKVLYLASKLASGSNPPIDRMVTVATGLK